MNNSFEEIYAKYYKKSYLFVKSYVHDDMVAEDIVSDVLVQLWKTLKTETITSIPPYLFVLLKNRSLDHLKHLAVKERAMDHFGAVLERELQFRTSSLEASDPKDFFSEEIQHIVQTTLENLPEKTREVFSLSRFGDKSHKEIAELFDISVKGVDYHIAKAIRELRHELKDYFPLVTIASLFV